MLFQHELSFINYDCGKNNTFRLYVNTGRVNDSSKYSFVKSEAYLQCENIALAAA